MVGRADCLGKVGTSFTARRWLSLNPCGFAGISCSFAIHLFAFFVVAKHLIEGSFFSQFIFLLIYVPLSFMAVWSLYMAWITNPGAVPMGARPLVTVRRAASGEMSPSVQTRKRGMRRCNKCNDNYKPNRAHHDSVTGRCIVKFDHYCPWVCNAVGAMNHKFFVLFVGYTMMTCMTAIFLIVLRAVRCGYTRDSEDANSTDDNAMMASSMTNATNGGEGEEMSDEAGNLDETRNLLRRWLQKLEPDFVHDECQDFHRTYTVVILFCVAVLFFIFTACMFVEQIEAIQTNQGKIARMKMRVGQGGTELTRVTDEFNEMFGGTSPHVAWHWFVPLPVEFPGSYYKVVMGYEWDPTFDAVPYREDDSADGSSTSATSNAGSSHGSPVGGGSMELPDIESGLPTENLDEVSIDSSENAGTANGSLKKRTVSSGGVDSLPEL